MHLQRHVDHALGVFGGAHLGHGSGHAARLTTDVAAAVRRGAALMGVAHPGGAVGQQGSGVYQGRHLAQLGLGELKVGQPLTEHLPALRVGHRFGQRAARHAQRCRCHRGAKNVQCLHGQLKAAIERAQLRVCIQGAICEPQAGQRVRRHQCNVLAAVKAGAWRVHDEGGHAARAGARRGIGEGDIKISHVAVADPCFATLQSPTAGITYRCRAQRTRVRAGLGLAQRKGGDLAATGDVRQIRGLLCGRAGERDSATAQALHGQRKVGQRRVKSQGFAQHHQRARVEFVERTAGAGRHAVAQPAGAAQALHPVAAGAAVILLVDHLLRRPVGQISGQRAVHRVKKRQAELVCGGQQFWLQSSKVLHVSRLRKRVSAWPQRHRRRA